MKKTNKIYKTYHLVNHMDDENFIDHTEMVLLAKDEKGAIKKANNAIKVTGEKNDFTIEEITERDILLW